MNSQEKEGNLLLTHACRIYRKIYENIETVNNVFITTLIIIDAWCSTLCIPFFLLLFSFIVFVVYIVFVEGQYSFVFSHC